MMRRSRELGKMIPAVIGRNLRSRSVTMERGLPTSV
jgi:hypothetical protein